MAPSWKFRFGGRILMIGFGSVGHCTMPLIIRHFDMPLDRIAVVDGDDHGAEIAPYVARACATPSIPSCRAISTAVSRPMSATAIWCSISASRSARIDVIEWCHRHGALYLDTCIEPWAHTTTMPRSRRRSAPTTICATPREGEGARMSAKVASALVTHGANPGLISHFVKQALLDIAGRRPRRQQADHPGGLGEADAAIRRQGDPRRRARPPGRQPAEAAGRVRQHLVVPGFVGEGSQPAELGWGTTRSGSAQRHASTRSGRKARSTSPAGLHHRGALLDADRRTDDRFLITHGESISTADYLTVRRRGSRSIGRPCITPITRATTPCCRCASSAARLPGPAEGALMDEEIVEGIDELGALLMGDHGALWYGSQLSIEEARELLGPQFNATSIQIAAPVLAGAIWLIEHPERGAARARGPRPRIRARDLPALSRPGGGGRATGRRSKAAASSSRSPASTGRIPGSSRTSG